MSESVEKALGKAIQAARKKAGLTQQELCMKTGISYSTLAKIERGAIQSPSVFTVVNIASLCGMSVEELVGASKFSPAPIAVERDFKTAKSGIQFVYFDLNGCLVRFFQGAFTAIAADTGASPERIEGVFWHYNDAVCRGEMSMEEFNRLLAEKAGVESIDWQEYYLKAVEVVEEAHEVLRWAAENFRVGLFSNIMPGHIDALLQRGLVPNIEYQSIIDSSKAGSIKPEARVYEIAEEAAGVPNENILLIDDDRANLMAAERRGWRVMWFDDFRVNESVDRIKQTLEL